MIVLQQGTQLGGANPLLEFFAARDGKLLDLYALSFSIWNCDSSTQVYPSSGSQVVNIGTTYPDADAGRLSLGRYVVTWTIPANLDLARYEVRWTYQLTSTEQPKQARARFDLVKNHAPEPQLIAGLYDLRDEGVSPSLYKDPRVLMAIQAATRTVERLTERFFYPRAMTLTLDGEGSPMLSLPLPIIAIESVTISSFGDSFDDVIDPADYRVYARHVSEGMVPPTDRGNPKIELGTWSGSHWQSMDGESRRCWGRRFPRGKRNVQVVGVFGCVEYDGSPMGRTPQDLVTAAKKLALKSLPKQNSSGAGAASAATAGPVKRLRTRDQEVEYSGVSASAVRSGMLTGDADVDDVILAYRRPPFIGAV